MFVPYLRTPPPGWPGNDLERVLDAAAQDPAHLLQLLPTFLQSSLWVVATEFTPEERAAHPEGGSKLMIVTIDARPMLLAFSSEPLVKASAAQPLLITETSAPTLVDYLGDTGIYLNPAGPYGKEFTPAEIRMGRHGVVPVGNQLHVAAHTEVIFTPFTEEPFDLVEAVTSACRADTTIHNAYLSGVHMPATGDTTPHPLIGLEADNYAAARDQVSRQARPWSNRTRQAIDYVDMRDKGTFQTHLRSAGKRIYKRAGWLGGLFGG